MILEKLSSEGQDTLKQEASQLRSSLESLKTLMRETLSIIGKCLIAWSDFQTSKDSVKEWIEEFKKKVDAEMDTGEKKTPVDLQRCHGLLDELNSQKPNVEELSDRCETLMELCACNWVRDKTVHWQTTYASLFNIVQELV
jgi:hypothetical protein